MNEEQKELLIGVLYDYAEFNKSFKKFTKKVAKDFGWSRQRLEYYIKQRKNI